MESQPPSSGRLDLSRLFLYAFLGLSLYLAFSLLKPFLHTLVISIVLASLFHPMHARISRAFRNRYPVLASSCTCAIIVLGVVIPLGLITLAIAEQGFNLFSSINEWVKSGGMERAAQSASFEWFRGILDHYVPYVDMERFDVQGNLISLSRSMGEVFLKGLTSFIGNVTSLIIHFFLMLFILYYFFKEGQDMLQRAMQSIPMSHDNKERVIQHIRVVSRSTVLGIFLTAVLQGIVGGAAALFVGLPGLFWGAMTGFTSLLPLVGTALVYGPISLFLLFKEQYIACLFYLSWNVVLNNVVDNIIRPKLMGRQGGVPPLLVFLSILGGLQVFGILGILYGPLIFGLCGILLYLYDLENADLLGNRG